MVTILRSIEVKCLLSKELGDVLRSSSVTEVRTESTGGLAVVTLWPSPLSGVRDGVADSP